jgi:hypothetical protein
MRRYSIAVVAAAAVSAIAVGLAQAAAPPGHEAMLRALIESAAHGKIDEQTLTPALFVAVQPQASVAQAEISALGKLTAVTFEQTAKDGSEIYLTTFERGALEWAFAVNADGRIANAMYRTPKPAP